MDKGKGFLAGILGTTALLTFPWFVQSALAKDYIIVEGLSSYYDNREIYLTGEPPNIYDKFPENHSDKDEIYVREEPGSNCWIPYKWLDSVMDQEKDLEDKNVSLNLSKVEPFGIESYLQWDSHSNLRKSRFEDSTLEELNRHYESQLDRADKMSVYCNMAYDLLKSYDEIPEDFYPSYMAMLEVESDFNPVAVSRSNAIGIAQLKIDTGETFGLYDSSKFRKAAFNMDASIRFVAELFEEYGTEQHAIAVYHSGETEANGAYKDLPIGKGHPNTTKYLQKVTDKIPKFEEVYRQIKSQRED